MKNHLKVYIIIGNLNVLIVTILLSFLFLIENYAITFLYISLNLYVLFSIFITSDNDSLDSAI